MEGGAFVSIGNIKGIVRCSRMLLKYCNTLWDLLQRGQEVIIQPGNSRQTCGFTESLLTENLGFRWSRRSPALHDPMTLFQGLCTFTWFKVEVRYAAPGGLYLEIPLPGEVGGSVQGWMPREGVGTNDGGLCGSGGRRS